MTESSQCIIHPRICVLVLMNHPFPKVIPTLRAIYADRFSRVLFLIPFEHMDDDDVITVYRGSYNHAAYLTDAYHILEKVDCDFFIVVHDDVLLNPQISEKTFSDLFPIGRDDGFIAGLGPLPSEAHDWAWLTGLFPKMLYPKSVLFGGGLEKETLKRYLPDSNLIQEKAVARGISPTRSIRINPGIISSETMPNAARTLLYGLNGDLGRSTPLQQSTFEDATHALKHLFSAAAADEAGRSNQRSWNKDPVEAMLPLPLLTSSYFTDIYILPRIKLREFSHYVGVAAAANLFVEIMAPTILFACCEHLWVADELGLDFSGFHEWQPLSWFEDITHIAMHPFKLSHFLAVDEGDRLVDALRDIAILKAVPGDAIAKAGFGSLVSGAIGLGPGWHPPHDWGVWSAAEEATIPVALDGPADILLELVAVLDPAKTVQTGCVIYNEGQHICKFASAPPSKAVSVTLHDVRPGADGRALLSLVSDKMVRPSDIDPRSGDERPLGFAFLKMTISPRQVTNIDPNFE